ncbi:MAG: hypothetical protein LBD45_03150 [Bacteroidales bacterium]|nr:hypothetical protein [Bacteroidales bacterium]
MPIIVAAISIEYLLRQIPNEYAYKRHYLDKNSNKIETLILGSSHSFFGINPAFMMENTFNSSNVSQSLKYDFKILTKYQNNFKNLTTIVLPIDYFSPWQDLAAGSENWRVKNYVLYYGMKSFKLNDYSEFLSIDLQKNLTRIKDHYITGGAISYSDLGWGTAYNSSKSLDLIKTGQTAAQRHTNDIFSKENQETYTKNLAILNSILNFCNQHNIKLILITSPTYNTYRENLSKIQLNKMFETIYNFVDEHKDVTYLNYFADTDFTEQDFYDADHLNEIGAEKFSRKLAHSIDSLNKL